MTEDEIRQLFREMGDEPLPAESLRRVRLAVAERTQPRTRAWWRSAAALAGAACAVLVILWLREPAAVRKTAPPVVASEEAVRPIELAPPSAGVRRKPQPSVGAVAKKQRRVEKPPATAADFVIRIETPDPDVVILLIGD
jgi:anti-sigma factor RsiW